MTLTSTADHATDLGYLLHKYPDKVQSFDLAVGRATVCYPEATDERCTVALLLEVDPIGLMRGAKGRAEGFALAQYVNDRPYAASSLMAVASVGTSTRGRSRWRRASGGDRRRTKTYG